VKLPIYTRLACLIQASMNCVKDGDNFWLGKHREAIDAIVKEHGPSGSGLDSGTQIDLAVSTGESLVFHTAFHHMNEHGTYDGWTKHQITVKPSLQHGVVLKVAGRDRNRIKDHLYGVFYEFLNIEIEA
jgi:hypothetical protein